MCFSLTSLIDQHDQPLALCWCSQKLQARVDELRKAEVATDRVTANNWRKGRCTHQVNTNTGLVHGTCALRR